MVVSGQWVGGDTGIMPLLACIADDQNLNMPVPFVNGELDLSNCPRAVLICRQNSHPFQERNLNLSQSIKIGRSVARDRVLTTNAIFECKVLSRNHALLWFENGKFYLQDTKSSNGTFINNQRLSPGGMESQPYEVCSGDVVQFGVDVIENARKVTHGCIVATLKLYLPDGEEAKLSQVGNQLVNSVNAMELFQLNQYIQEATVREQQLEGKLGHLQHIVEETKSGAQQAWQALLQEDLLLTRIDVLESKLQVYSANANEDVLRAEMTRLLSDKLSYQESATEALRRATEERAAETQRCLCLEQELVGAQRDRERAQHDVETAQQELQEVTSQLCQCQSRVSSLSSQCCGLAEVETQLAVLRAQISEGRHNEAMSRARLLCKQAQLACKSSARNCNNVKNTKSEGDILDNKGYQACNHESLLLKMELQMDHLQRRLAEINAAYRNDIDNTSLQDNSDHTLSEANDNHSDVTVLECRSGMALPMSRKQDDNDNQNPERSSTHMMQVATALLELRTQRELLQVFSQEDSEHETPSQIAEQQNDMTELRAENERLEEIIKANQQQVDHYEQELAQVNRKVETLHLELQTRPSHESLQDKENVCVNQEMTIGLLNMEIDQLRKVLTQRKMAESGMQAEVDILLHSTEDLEKCILDLKDSILEKDECINTLRQELDLLLQVEKVINEDSFSQTESEPKREALETTTQTPKIEHVDFENTVQKDFEFLNDVDNELKQEIVLLKEKCSMSSEENIRLLRSMGKLQIELNDAVKHTRTMALVYLAPLLALLCYILLMPYMAQT